MQTAVQISIHALRVEGDHLPLSFLHTVLYFYPRPPGGGRYTAYLSPVVVSNFYPRPPSGGRPRRRTWLSAHCPFLSTPSGWRATRADNGGDFTARYFYPRPPGGGRHFETKSIALGWLISIHALRVEGDVDACRCIQNRLQFLSTPSGWRATRWGLFCYFKLRVFLSTPSGWRATVNNAKIKTIARDFYPRPPGGGRL